MTDNTCARPAPTWQPTSFAQAHGPGPADARSAGSGLGLTAGTLAWAASIFAFTTVNEGVPERIGDLTGLAFQLGVFCLLAIQFKTRATGLSHGVAAEGGGRDPRDREHLVAAARGTAVDPAGRGVAGAAGHLLAAVDARDDGDRDQDRDRRTLAGVAALVAAGRRELGVRDGRRRWSSSATPRPGGSAAATC